MSRFSEPVPYSLIPGFFLRPTELCPDQPITLTVFVLHVKQQLEAETVLLTPQHSRQHSALKEQLRLGMMDRKLGQSGELIPAAPEPQPPEQRTGRKG